jgi:hypothetical protein
MVAVSKKMEQDFGGKNITYTAHRHFASHSHGNCGVGVRCSGEDTK